MSPSVSVITVCFNDPSGLEKTIKSVIGQDYSNFEYIVIDGGSRQDTLSVLNAYKSHFAFWCSEPDKGIYDAMNKGLAKAGGEWYIMMNAGDIFSSPSALRENIEEIAAANVSWGGGGSLIELGGRNRRMYFSDSATRIFHHQSLFLKRDLHQKYGFYEIAPATKAWDYFFFNLLRKESFHATGKQVSVCDGAGVSASVKNYLDVAAMDFIFGHEGALWTAAKFALYPLYRMLSRIRYALNK